MTRLNVGLFRIYFNIKKPMNVENSVKKYQNCCDRVVFEVEGRTIM